MGKRTRGVVLQKVGEGAGVVLWDGLCGFIGSSPFVIFYQTC
jgi:hypothetical protein